MKAKILVLFLSAIATFILAICFSSVNAHADAYPGEGVYTISSGVGNFMMLDIKSGSRASQANVQIYTENGTGAQQFRLKKYGNYYIITNVRSGKALDVKYASKANKANIWQYSVNHTKAQLWRFVNAGSGYFYIINVGSGKALDVDCAKNTNGTNVQQYTQNQTKAQKWRLHKVTASEGGKTLNNALAVTNLKGTAAYNNKITLTWNAVKGAKGYEIFRNGVKIKTQTALKFTDTGLGKNTNYQYKVRAYTDKQYGPFAFATLKTIFRNPKILMVDNQSFNNQIADKFRAYGCSVTTVYSSSKIDPSKYDAVVIPGGGDVTPSLYGASRSSRTAGCDLTRDRLQIQAVKAFMNAGKPVFGVCRGQQVINVALGGTLNQHIGTGHQKSRNVRFKSGCLLYKQYGSTQKFVHAHHQAISKLGSGLVAVGWDATDGTIEAVEHNSKPIYAVQFHPERSSAGNKVYSAWTKIVLENMAK